MSSPRRDFRLLVTKDSYETEMMLLSSRKDLRHVRIASFGLQVGVNATGSVFPNNWAHNFLKHLEARKAVVSTEVLIGSNTSIITSVVQNSASVFPSLDWYVHPESHFKTTIYTFKDKTYCSILGGRNLSSSGWADISFRTTDLSVYAELVDLFDNLRRSGKKIIPLPKMRVFDPRRNH